MESNEYVVLSDLESDVKKDIIHFIFSMTEVSALVIILVKDGEE